MQKILMTLLTLMFSSVLLTAQDGDMKKAYFAGGCFWGVEYHLEKLDGVQDVVSGFMGGHVKNPSYKDVVRKRTGHVETVAVTYDPKKISYETIAKNFFEIHDFTQRNGQGPDIGSQYLSVIFYDGAQEKEVAEKLIGILSNKGFSVATKVQKVATFYPAEGYHQDYYQRHGKVPYCHSYSKIFD